ncbi:MAG: hypothetical protein GXO16_07715 [Epsilonproteobacteria bacterium]|nr:hypothetical protein [Campylobacterota bacterium]
MFIKKDGKVIGQIDNIQTFLEQTGYSREEIAIVFSEKELKEMTEAYIYNFYPQVKQASDIADKNYYEMLLKAKGATNLEADIVARAERFFGGESLESIISDVADTEKEAYEQLLKVAIRVKWVQDCKAELKAAIAEEREPNFPDYPL